MASKDSHSIILFYSQLITHLAMQKLFSFLMLTLSMVGFITGQMKLFSESPDLYKYHTGYHQCLLLAISAFQISGLGF